MKWARQSLNKIVLLLIAIFLVNVSCKHEKKDEAASEAFVLSDSMAKKIELAVCKKEKVENELKLTAKIEINQDKQVDVFPLVSGRIQGLEVSLGDYVTKGKVLTYVLSENVAAAERDILAAEGNLISIKRKLSAANDMYKSGLTSEKDLVQAQTDNELAEAEAAKARKMLDLYGSQYEGLYEVKSPINGFILKKNVTDNEDVKSDFSTSMFTIADLSELWVMVNIFETDIRKIKVGHNAIISTIAYPDSIIEGKVDKLFDVLDQENRVMKARITLKNANSLLKPEMFARVIIRYTDEEEKLCIPSSAVIFDNNKNYVMVFKSNKDIETREITIYKANSKTTYISEGLKEGEKVISKYQLLVYDAIND